MLTIYELEHNTINFNSDRLAALSFNPLRMTSKNHVGLNSELDHDKDYHIKN